MKKRVVRPFSSVRFALVIDLKLNDNTAATRYITECFLHHKVLKDVICPNHLLQSLHVQQSSVYLIPGSVYVVWGHAYANYRYRRSDRGVKKL